MPTTAPTDIRIQVRTRWLEEQSEPSEQRFVFAYTIRIRNQGTVSAQLIARHWRITDANGAVEEVHGEGVVGEQPWLGPGESFEYTSGAVLRTECGSMQGAYDMVTSDGRRFQVPIAAFVLSTPRTLH